MDLNGGVFTPMVALLFLSWPPNQHLIQLPLQPSKVNASTPWVWRQLRQTRPMEQAFGGTAGMGFPRFPRVFVKTKHQKNDTKITFTPKKSSCQIISIIWLRNKKTVVITVITLTANFKIILQSRSMAQPEVFRYFKKTCMYTLENKHRTCKSWFQKEISSSRGHFQVSHFQVPQTEPSQEVDVIQETLPESNNSSLKKMFGP